MLEPSTDICFCQMRSRRDRLQLLGCVCRASLFRRNEVDEVQVQRGEGGGHGEAVELPALAVSVFMTQVDHGDARGEPPQGAFRSGALDGHEGFGVAGGERGFQPGAVVISGTDEPSRPKLVVRGNAPVCGQEGEQIGLVQ